MVYSQQEQIDLETFEDIERDKIVKCESCKHSLLSHTISKEIFPERNEWIGNCIEVLSIEESFITRTKYDEKLQPVGSYKYRIAKLIHCDCREFKRVN